MVFPNTIINDDVRNVLSNIKDRSIDLILTDPPYEISKDSNFHYNLETVNKDYAYKFNRVSNDFGNWDKETLDWNFLAAEFRRILKSTGTVLMFYDIWKLNVIKEAFETNKFNQPRIGVWVKNNPVPLNQHDNYLSNAKEYFVSYVKYRKPTFHSEYDNAVYYHNICNGNEREDHPTQKPLKLIEEILLKHSNPGDLILDPFAGTFTSCVAAKINNRNYIGIERELKYFNIGKRRLEF